jgi:hypothetical protein
MREVNSPRVWLCARLAVVLRAISPDQADAVAVALMAAKIGQTQVANKMNTPLLAFHGCRFIGSKSDGRRVYAAALRLA